jgi:hypothetical protein
MERDHLPHLCLSAHNIVLAAIILFSGLGSIEVAQESLSVGIGALAGKL